MIASHALLVVLLTPNFCDEPVKPAKAEYFKGDVADRFPPGHLLDNMYQSSRTSDLNEMHSRLEEMMSDNNQLMSVTTGIPLPLSERRKLEKLRKKPMPDKLDAKANGAKSPDRELIEPEIEEPNTPKTIGEFNRRVLDWFDEQSRRTQLIRAIQANQAAKKSTPLEDATLKRLEKEDEEYSVKRRVRFAEYLKDKKERDARDEK